MDQVPAFFSPQWMGSSDVAGQPVCRGGFLSHCSASDLTRAEAGLAAGHRRAMQEEGARRCPFHMQSFPINCFCDVRQLLQWRISLPSAMCSHVPTLHKWLLTHYGSS